MSYVTLWVKWGRWKIIKKVRKFFYFNKKVCVIDKLMWMFCKSDDVVNFILFNEYK